jgi:hypothetical protein
MIALRKVVGLLVLAASALALSGCDRGPTRIPVRGVVTYKGSKLADGWITFVPADADKGTQEAARITDGKYELPIANGLMPGSYRVAITATEPSPAPTPGAPPGAPKRGKEVLPDEYNRDSNLAIEVPATGQRDFDFELK